MLSCDAVTRWMLILALSTTFACDSSKDESTDKAAGATEAAKAGKTAPAKKPAPPEKSTGLPVATKLDCATLTPSDLVAKHFPGAQVTQYDKAAVRKRMNLPPQPAVARCDIGNDMGPITVIDFKCSMYLDDKQVAETYKQVAGDKLISGLGRGAAELPMQISVADDDTACVIVLSYLSKHRDPLLALAKDLVSQVTPAVIGAAP